MERKDLQVPRFWYEVGADFDLTTDGFLIDPFQEENPKAPLNAHSLSSLREARLLILLGEPGIGKSIEIEQARRLPSSHLVRFLNLKDFSTEESLRFELDNDIVIHSWQQEGGVLELFLDSFDESPIPNRASVVLKLVNKLAGSAAVRRVGGISKPFNEDSQGLTDAVEGGEQEVRMVGELRIRLGCRMGAYAPILGEGLAHAVKAEAEATFVYKLAPIRLSDAVDIVSSGLPPRK